MENQSLDPKPKKLLSLIKWALFGALAVAIIGGITYVASDTHQASVAGVQAVASPVPTPTIAATPIPTLTLSPAPSLTVSRSAVQTPTPTPGLSNDNHYTNSAGNEVHSPAYSNSVPAGATAICGDGTYSFSQSRRGTCSHHGGVSQWL